MSRFRGELLLLDNGDGCTFTVMAALAYDSDLAKTTITVPAGIVTDLASIPLLANHRTWSKAAVVHDFLYQVAVTTRKQADDILYEAMGVLKVPGWRKAVVYSTLRLFGQKAWDAHREAT